MTGDKTLGILNYYEIGFAQTEIQKNFGNEIFDEVNAVGQPQAFG